MSAARTAAVPPARAATATAERAIRVNVLASRERSMPDIWTQTLTLSPTEDGERMVSRRAVSAAQRAPRAAPKRRAEED
ncbi:hypothetical protein AwMethylo_08930 [Methylobacterium sp.]|nr:hypothetical protein AwMethylo_08930 [Methylobacterium sp.]